MGTYLIKAKYTAAAFKGMLVSPGDRASAYHDLADAVGIEVREIFFSLSSSEIVILADGDKEQMAISELVTMAGGSFSQIDTLELINTGDLEALTRKAADFASVYKPPTMDEIDRVLLDE